jgi:hypothetical protein
MSDTVKRESRARRLRRIERIDGLRRRGEFERDALAREVAGLRGSIDQKRARWKTAGRVAGIAAVAWTVGYRLFGKHSISAKIGRITSVAQVLFGLGRAAGRVRRFW